MMLGAAAAIAFALTLSAHVASIEGIDVESRYPGVWWLHGTAMLLVAPAVVLTLRGAGGRLRFRDVMAMIPWWAGAAIALALLYALANLFWLAPATGAGDPLVAGHKFFFNDHGALRQVSETDFHAERAATLRLYSAHWLCLNLSSGLFLLVARKAARR
jgi:hypothetical protein